jgi:CRISPR/Cas system-associated protein Cas7 (RAMP superfamily)|tara:strand:+ start:554 stop:751 length:198 start_codon:yes stop_codon:yes gene_type:complete
MEVNMLYKVHWLIDGVIEIESDKIENAEKTIKDKIEFFISENSVFFEEMGAKAVQGQAYLPGKDE